MTKPFIPKTARRVVHRLSPEDQEKVQRLAKQRFLNNRANGVRDMKVGAQSAIETDMMGLGGEVAFARIAGVEPDWSVDKPDNGFDGRLPDGRSYDVKTSHHARANLVARVIHEEVDVFVLLSGRFPTYEVVGWIDRETFGRAKKKRLAPQYPPTHFYARENLHPIDTLLG